MGRVEYKQVDCYAITFKLKGTSVKPVLLYGVWVTKKQKLKVHMEEMHVLGEMCRVTKKDKNRSRHIRGKESYK